MPTLASVGSAIISLSSYWCKIKNDETYFKLTLILPLDVYPLTQEGNLMLQSDSDTLGEENSQDTGAA